MKAAGGVLGWRGWVRRLVRVFLGLGVVLFLMILWANYAAVWVSRGRLFEDVTRVPEQKVGLVFGTTDRVSGRENLYFRYRIDAAVEAWNAGKLETLLVSGDNRSRFYNEPERMKEALVRRGLPAGRIVCDFAGLRTFDSVVRAKEVFGVDSMLVISQRFQNERAIYIARAHGIEAFGYNARDVNTQGGLRVKIREVGARVVMWLDVNVLNTRPQFLGPLEEMPR